MFSERYFVGPKSPANHDNGKARENHECAVDRPFTAHEPCTPVYVELEAMMDIRGSSRDPT